MKNIATVLAVALSVALVLTGCRGTPSSRMSRDLKPILSSEEIEFKVDSFAAWIRGPGYLQIDVDALREETDYRPGFDLELQQAAALCAAVANSDLAFGIEWWALKINSRIWYRGRAWTTPSSWTEIFVSREELVELRERGALADEFPRRWIRSTYKTGPCAKNGVCTLSTPWPDTTSSDWKQ